MCELALEQLRNNRKTVSEYCRVSSGCHVWKEVPVVRSTFAAQLLNVLSTMRHDPLVEWAKRNVNEDASGRNDSTEVPE